MVFKIGLKMFSMFSQCGMTTHKLAVPLEISSKVPGIRPFTESVLTACKAERCVGKMAKVCPDEVAFGPGWEVIKTHGRTILMHTGIDDGVFPLGFFDSGSRAGVIP